jgi:hypothetical protein
MRSHLLKSSLLLLSVGLVFALPALATNSSSPRLDACPIGLSAQQDSNQALLATRANPAVPAQLLRLTIQNKRLPRIVQAEIEIHGTSASGRVVGNDPHPEDTVKHVTLKSSVRGDQSVIESVTAEDLTSVAFIEVMELRYADGTVWHVSSAAQCMTNPDGFMLAGK